MDFQERNNNPFHFIPKKKLDETISDLRSRAGDTLADCRDLSKIISVFYKYYNSNIPVDYWFREMSDFKGHPKLVDSYNSVVKDIKKSYMDGVKICLAGKNGVGKTMSVACMLKRVAETDNYSCLYVNLTDIVNVLASNNDENKQQARKLLLEVDFLAIDEFDPRFIGSEKAADLFGRIIEPVIRTRIQNKLPLFMCTNSPNVTEGFSGALEISIKSLMNVMRIVPVIGKDYREVIRGQ